LDRAVFAVWAVEHRKNDIDDSSMHGFGGQHDGLAMIQCAADLVLCRQHGDRIF
jgi:hypothetical protein